MIGVQRLLLGNDNDSLRCSHASNNGINQQKWYKTALNITI